MDGELEGVEAVRVICRRKGGREEVRVVFVLFLQLVTPPFLPLFLLIFSPGAGRLGRQAGQAPPGIWREAGRGEAAIEGGVQ